MDAAETFRYLLANKAIPNKGVSVNNFVFKTVFYKCGPSYCICRCAYDHEFLSYVSENGDVNEEMLDTLTTAIKDGCCQHASKFTKTCYLRKTGINIFHIAAALDFEEMLQTFISGLHFEKIDIWGTRSQSFKLHPFEIAALRGNALVLPLLINLHPSYTIRRRWNGTIIHASERQSNVLYVERSSLLEIYIGKRDHKMVDLLLDCTDPAHALSHRERIYEFLFINNLTDMLDAILDRIMAEHETWRRGVGPGDSRIYKVTEDVPSIVKLAVMYNQRGIYDKSLHLLSEGRTSLDGNPLLSVRNADGHPLVMVCEAFNWGPNLKRIIQKEIKTLKETCPINKDFNWGNNNKRLLQKKIETLKEASSMKNVSNFVYLYGLLTHYPSSGLQIKQAMEQLPDIGKIINTPFDANSTEYATWKGLTPFQSYISSYTMVSMENTRTLIDLGADIDTVYPKDLTVFSTSLKRCVKLKERQSLILHLCIVNEGDSINKLEWRKILELLLYENVSLDMNKTVVGFGLEHYKEQVLYKSSMQVSTSCTRRMNHSEETFETGTYIMDAELHESALDFVVPLLIEAGFHYTRADIEDTTNFPIVPPDESKDGQERPQWFGAGSRGPLPLEKNHVLEYLGQCLLGPIPLMCLCRNVLRKHFPRRQIHSYVSSGTIPKKMKDYLLLKPLLKTLPDDM